MRFIFMFVTAVCVMCYSPFHRASVHVTNLSVTYSADIVRGIYVSTIFPGDKSLPSHMVPGRTSRQRHRNSLVIKGRKKSLRELNKQM